MVESLKIKHLTKPQIQIAFDRLTRFKNTEDKYLRVFKETILSNLIEPKFKKSELDTMDYQKLTLLAATVFNQSIKLYSNELSKDYSINKILKNYEESTFKFGSKVKQLLENNIDFKSAIDLFEGDLPINLKWLKSLEYFTCSVSTREEFELKFPLEKIIITEGITEEILLPRFAIQQNFHFDKEGIHIISAGGKNQVVKLFYKLSEDLKLPIFVLLDNDATQNYQEIKPKLRAFDKVHVLKSGEFEDTLPHELILRALNNQFKNFAKVEMTELEQDSPMTHILENIFKEKYFDEFKKAEFAHLIAENLKKEDISSEINQVFEEIKNMKK